VHGKVDIVGATAEVNGALGREQLEQHDAEAVDVALVRELVVAVVLRVQVPQRPLRAGGDVAQPWLRQPGQPEVRDLAVEPVVQEDVARLDVAVVDGRRGREVQVRDALRRLARDGQALVPPERRAVHGAVQVVGEGAVGDELVHHQRLLQVDAAAEQAHQAAVVHLRQHAHLVQDLVRGFGVAELGALDGHDRAVAEHALVDLAVATDAKEVVAGEVARGALQLATGEVLGGAPARVVGVQDLLALLGQPLSGEPDALLPAIDEQRRRGNQQRAAEATHQPCIASQTKHFV